MIKSYSELITIESYEDRFEYLRIGGKVGEETFGASRPENQRFYQSEEWRRFRRDIIARDLGFDMSHRDYEIVGPIIIHHINPITEDDIYYQSPKLFDPENVICVSDNTHKAIHYGTLDNLTLDYQPRSKGDTTLW